MSLASAVQGAVAGFLASELVQRAAARVKGTVAPPSDQIQHGSYEDQLLVHMVSMIYEDYKDAQRLRAPRTQQTIWLSTQVEQILSVPPEYERVSLFTPTALTVIVRTPDGSYNRALTAGWNQFDYPDQTGLTLATGGATTVNVRILWASYSLSGF